MSYGTLISTVTVGAGGAASVDFTSIPQTYTDLVIVFSLRSTAAPGWGSDYVNVKFNGSTTTFSSRLLGGDGSSVSSPTAGAYLGPVDGAGQTANTFGNGYAYIPNYAGSTNKAYSSDAVNEGNAVRSEQYLTAGLWATTSAITSISIVSGNSGSFVQYSTASLYGVK